MPTKKIASFSDLWSHLGGEKRCRDPEHHPPAMIVREPGLYEHACPNCGRVQVFTVQPEPEWKTAKQDP